MLAVWDQRAEFQRECTGERGLLPGLASKCETDRAECEIDNAEGTRGPFGSEFSVGALLLVDEVVPSSEL